MRRFNGMEPELVGDERNRFERAHAGPDTAASRFKIALNGLRHHFKQVRRHLGDGRLGCRHPAVRRVGLAVVFDNLEMTAREAVGDFPEAVAHGGATKRGRA